jgi:hypothetical protein
MRRISPVAFPLLFCLLSLCLSIDTMGQLSAGGVPFSFSRAPVPDTAVITAGNPPASDILAMEDELSPLPYRFAVNIPVSLDLDHSGNWETSGSTRIWKATLKSPGALALILYFDRYRLPEGGKLFIYNPARTQLFGAYTSANNNRLSTFSAGLIYGDAVTIEYNSPAELPLPDLHLSEVGHAYRGVTEPGKYPGGFNGSGPCHVNVNCEEGGNWQDQNRGVARIIVKRNGGSTWCSGSLIDNVRHDGTPYFLTADHCGIGCSAEDLSQWIFFFNYESDECPDPLNEPPLKSLTGATLVAHGGNAGSTGSDFFLVRLNSEMPASYNAYFNGWSRETDPPSPSGVSIHHPQGDIKKISTYTSPVLPARWSGNPALCYWRVAWVGTANGHGTTEGGSSGSPLFDNSGRIIGTLTGGDSSCDSARLKLPDYYGMFSWHWDKNGTDSASMLKCWLDPDNTNVMTLKGWAISVQEDEREDHVRVCPNPFRDQLNLVFNDAEGQEVNVSVFDAIGIRKFSAEMNTHASREMKIDLQGLARGMYMLLISGRDRTIVKKIIRE